MKLIPLTQGKATLVSSTDFKRFGSLRWCAELKKDSGDFYAKRGVNGSTEYLHRAIMDAPNDMKVDHRNHNTLDNRRHNLRVCSNSENIRNRRGPNSNSTTGVRGVTFDKSRGKWAARIVVGGKKLHLGRFDKKSSAATAYAEANLKHYGSFGGCLGG